jgi:hypothetical protein
MDQPRPSRQEIDERSSVRCPECTADLFPPSDDWHHPSTYDLRCSNEVVRHFPHRPWWWNEPDHEDRRKRVVDEFNQFDLVILTQEIAQSIDDWHIDSTDEASQFVRRLLALCWQIEVAQLWLASFSFEDMRETAIWRAEIKHAARVSELGWRSLLTVTSSFVAVGVVDAASRSFEVAAANE